MEANNEMLPWEEAQATTGTVVKSTVSPQVKVDKSPWEEAQEFASQYVKPVINTLKELMPWEEAQKAPKQQVYSKPTISFNPVENIINKLIHKESAGIHTNPDGSLLTNAKSGAQGITQVMPASGINPGFGIKPLQNDSKEEYIRFAKDYLNTMYKRYNGDMEKTLASYNWGVGNVDKIIKKYPEDWKTKLPKETKDYITKILGN